MSNHGASPGNRLRADLEAGRMVNDWQHAGRRTTMANDGSKPSSGGRTRRLVVATLALALAAMAPAVAGAAATDAVPWLAGQAQADGSYAAPADVAAPLQATAETLRAFAALGETAQPGQAAALAYLNADGYSSTEILARRTFANAAAGGDVSPLAASLVTAQNRDGGFGEGPGYQSTSLDTAWALEALTAAGQASSAAAGNAVAFLLGTQRADGSWSDAQSTRSVYATALATAALSNLRFRFDLSAPLDRATTYLLGERQPDGSIGETFETALTLLALAPVRFDATSYQDVVDFLTTAQSPNGSWGDDVYTTALAARALTLAATPGAPDPTRGAVAGRITDAADGTPLSGVVITLSGSDNRSATTAVDGTFAIPDVQPGDVSLTATLAGYHGASATGTVQAGQTLTANLALTAQEPASPVTLFGTIVDADTLAPLAGVTVSVSHDPATAVTGADGTFRIEGLPAGSFGVHVELAGYQPLDLSVTASGGGLVGTGTLTLPSTAQPPTGLGAVAGTVSDEATGQPIEGATVALSGADNQTTTTSADGGFSFTGLQPGDVTLAVSATGYYSATAIGTVVADQTLSALIRLPQLDGPQTVTLVGTVVDANTSAPLAGALIDVLSLGFGTTAGADGSFEIRDLPAGTLTVEISYPGYTSVRLSISAPNGGTASLGVVTLAPETPPSGNQDPVISSQAPTTATVGRTYAYNPVASDPDGDPIVFGLTGFPSGMTIDPSTGAIRWIPTLDQAGHASFVLVVLDDQGGRAEEHVTVQVATGGGRSYVITDLATLDTFRLPEVVPQNYVLGSYISGGSPGFVSQSPACPLSWFSGGSDVAGALATLDRRAVQPAPGRDVLVDLGEPYASVVVFPQIDHGPLPQEGIEYTVWGADSPDAPFPGGWRLGTLVTIFNKGWVDDPACTGEETDDDTGLYTFGAEAFRYVRVRADYSISIFNSPSYTSWQGSGDDGGEPGWQSSEAEIDAVGGMVCLDPPTAEAGPDLTALTGDVVHLDATGSAGAIRTFGWDLDGDHEIDLAGAEADWVFPAEVDTDVTLLVVDELGCVGTDTLHLTVALRRPLPDLTVDSIDDAFASIDPQSLEISGQMAVTVTNIGNLGASAPALVTLFEDANGNALFDAGLDNELGSASMPSQLAEGAQDTVSVPVFGHVTFRDAHVLAMVDSDRALDELREDNNVGSTESGCRFVPPPAGQLDLALQWKWSGPSADPSKSHVLGPAVVGQLTDDNGDGRIDDRDVPDLVFPSGAASTTSSVTYLNAVSGDDGHEIWSRSDLDVTHRGSAALGDIDGDGIVEIVISDKTRSNLIALEHDGTLKWTAPTGPRYTSLWVADGISIVDLDKDGQPEIIQGRRAFAHDGTPLWTGTKDRGGTINPSGWGYASIAADVDLAGGTEVIAGRTLYDAQGNVVWHRSDLPSDGYNGVGNFDTDDEAEIVLVASGRVYLLEHDGSTKWGPVSLPSGGRGGPPTVADFDGDGEPEIGVAGASRYTVFETDGTVKWTSPTQDRSSNLTGSSVFDFEADGRAEVLYADETTFRIYDGTSGTVLAAIHNTSVTTLEYPNVADVDNDGSAEIIVPSNGYGSNPTSGVRVYEAATGGWAPTRGWWNQHSYHITNIEDDGRIPAVEQPSWLTHNTYRLNAFLDRDPIASPDLTASFLRIVEGAPGDPAELVVRIGNGGAAASPEGVSVAFYEGDPEGGGLLLGTVLLAPLAPGAYVDVSLAVDSLSGTEDVWAVVDPDDRVGECREDNNATRTAGDARATAARIAVATDAPFYPPAAPVELRATVTNPSGLAGEFEVALHVEDADGALVAAFAPRPTGLLAGMDAVTIVEPWNTADLRTGIYTLVGTVSTLDGLLLDRASAPFEIRSSDTGAPVAALGVSTDRPVYNTSDLVEILSVATNLTTNRSIDDAVLRLEVRSPTGQVMLSRETSLGQLAPRTVRSHDDDLVLDHAAIGTYTVTATLHDGPAGETLAQDQTLFRVEEDPALALSGQVTAQLPELFVGDDQTCTASLANGGTLPFDALEVEILLVGIESEEVIATEGFTVDLPVGPVGETTTLESVFSTRGLDPADYACVLRARVDQQGDGWTVLDADPFHLAEPPIKIDGDLRVGDRGRLLALGAWGCADQGAGSGDEQRDYLRQVLDAGGWSYTLVASPAEFVDELRTGGYTLYALFGPTRDDERTQGEGCVGLGGGLLSKQAVRELREAVFRGEGLVVAGYKESRINDLEDALGLRIKAGGRQPTGFDLDPSPVHPGGSMDFDPRVEWQRLDLAGATAIGALRPSGDPVAAVYGYGAGRSVTIGFDLLTQGRLAGLDSLFSELLLGALDWAHPEDLVPRSGGVLPVHVELVNQGIATPGRVILELPDGVSVVDAGGASIGPDGELSWPFDLAEEETVGFDAWLLLPAGPASVELTARIETGIDPDWVEHDVLTLPIVVPAAPTPADVEILVDDALGLELTDADYAAVRDALDEAATDLANGDPSSALSTLVDATDELLDVSTPEGRAVRIGVDELLLEVSRSIPYSLSNGGA